MACAPSHRGLGLRELSGAFGARVIRAALGDGAEPRWHAHELAFRIVYVLRGWVRFECENAGEVELHPGDGVYRPPDVRHHEVAHSDNLVPLKITSPADFAIAEVQVSSAA
jgi:quercetin dioxygenase-like cupin family protein